MTRQQNLHSIIVSADDHERLLALSHALASQQNPLGSLMLATMERADVRDAEDVPCDTVSLDRFVSYRVGGSGPPERRLLIHPDDRMWSPAELAVDTALGLALIGRSAGECALVEDEERPERQWIEVLAVEGEATGGLARRPTFDRRKPLTIIGGSGRMP